MTSAAQTETARGYTLGELMVAAAAREIGDGDVVFVGTKRQAQKAVEAAKQWRFTPGKRLGQPVPVLVTIELTFTLR